MTLPNSLGFGGTGYHGDDAVNTRAALAKIVTLANEIKTDHNALLIKLDADDAVTDVDYVNAARTIAAAAAAAPSTEQGSGGAYWHGNGGVASRNALEAARTIANEARSKHVLVRAKLAADGGVSDVTLDDASVNEVQTVTITATAGTFTITYGGDTTDAIAYNAAIGVVQDALEDLSTITIGDVAVTGSPGAYTLTFGGALAGTNVSQVTCSAAGLTQAAGTGTAAVSTPTAGVAAVNAELTIKVNAAAGQFKLVYSGQTTADIAYNASAGAVQTALEALSNIAPGDVTVTGGPGDATGSALYTVVFGGALAAAPRTITTAAGTVALSGSSGGTDPNACTIVSTVTGVVPVNEVQNVTVTANGGTYTITYSGQTTAALAHTATAAEVQAALEALSNLAPADVVVTGGPGNATGSTPYVLTYGGTLAGTNVAAVTTTVAALKAIGTSVPATSTAGSSHNIVTAAAPAIHPVLAEGGTGIHGDEAVRVRNQIRSLMTLLNEIKDKHNTLLAALDSSGATDTNYAALRTIAAANAA